MVAFRESSTYVSLPRMRLFFRKNCGSVTFFLPLEDENIELKTCLRIFSSGVFFTYDKQRKDIQKYGFLWDLLVLFYGDSSETTFSLSLGHFIWFRIK